MGGSGLDNRYLVTDLQQPLGANSEEWKIIAPVLAKVVAGEEALASTGADENGGGDFGGGRGGMGGPGGGNDTFGGPASTADGGRGRGGRGRGMGGDFGPGGMGGGNPAPAAAAPAGDAAISPGITASASNRITLPQALSDLSSALASADTSEGQLKERVALVRDARKRTEAEVAAGRKELLKILTLDQEAALVALGYLD